uniref:Uncharacterized protein n=1 Tax=Anguilla anguilla TaxID=7936 RepID=A0A0E9SB99_ANGAN
MSSEKQYWAGTEVYRRLCLLSQDSASYWPHLKNRRTGSLLDTHLTRSEKKQGLFPSLCFY